jgi:hypothetical protein
MLLKKKKVYEMGMTYQEMNEVVTCNGKKKKEQSECSEG